MKTLENINKDKLEYKTFVLLYVNILLVWERSFKLKKTGYSIKNKNMKVFKNENGLDLYISENIKEINEIIKKEKLVDCRKNFFVFISSNSQPFDLFRHLRNSVAHGNYKKQKIGKYIYLKFEDRYRKKLTMIGQVRLINLEGFILALYKSSRK